jgi:hypothetical protein
VISGTVEVDDVSEGQARSVGGDFVSEFWMGEPSASMRIDTEGGKLECKEKEIVWGNSKLDLRVHLCTKGHMALLVT